MILRPLALEAQGRRGQQLRRIAHGPSGAVEHPWLLDFSGFSLRGRLHGTTSSAQSGKPRQTAPGRRKRQRRYPVRDESVSQLLRPFPCRLGPCPMSHRCHFVPCATKWPHLRSKRFFHSACTWTRKNEFKSSQNGFCAKFCYAGVLVCRKSGWQAL